ncbi:MAG: DNA cytosine methyltransferase [Muribaculaceae bacterium]|nr:DNA cytosine methyltransferase [Muribaculaceae bacterium]
MANLNFIDLFAGCGGLSEGFLQSNHFTGLAHVEWETPMVNTLRTRLVERWGESVEEARRKVIQFDIQKTDELINGKWEGETIDKYASNNAQEAQLGLDNIIKNKKVDVIIGGPPCQAYSIHGRAKDKDSMQNDYRNFLFESFVKVVDHYKPRVFVFENVAGILSAKPKGVSIINEIHKAFKSIGYNILEPDQMKSAVFNAGDFNVPQHRPRIIIFGVRNDGDLQLNELYSALRSRICAYKPSVRDAIGHLPPIYPLNIVTKVKNKNLSHYATDSSDLFHQPRHCSSRDLETIRTWIANNMNSFSHKDAIEFYKRVTGKDTLYIKYRNLEWDKPSPTVVAHLQKDGFMFLHPDLQQARFISVREAALLMTFPADYTFVGAKSICYKMIGNAVPVNFAHAIADSIYEVISK